MFQLGDQSTTTLMPQEKASFASSCKLGRILVCETYPGMREVFDLMLGKQYETAFTDDPAQIVPTLEQRSARLLIWDLDGTGCNLDTLQEIRNRFPGLKVVLVAGEFDYEFQVAVIQRCGLVKFLTKVWESSTAVTEQIQVMLGDRKSSIRQWVLRVPISS